MKVHYDIMKTKIKSQLGKSIDESKFDLSTHVIRLFLDKKPLDYYKTKRRTKEAVFTAIDNWDVKSVSNLVQIFPDVYPTMQDKPLSITKDDNGSWVVSC